MFMFVQVSYCYRKAAGGLQQELYIIFNYNRSNAYRPSHILSYLTKRSNLAVL